MVNLPQKTGCVPRTDQQPAERPEVIVGVDNQYGIQKRLDSLVGCSVAGRLARGYNRQP